MLYSCIICLDISSIGLTNEEMTTVEYVRNILPSAKVVEMSSLGGELILTGNDMDCLIRPPNESGRSKWINDQVHIHFYYFFFSFNFFF
jgi:hypothetical protein